MWSSTISTDALALGFAYGTIALAGVALCVRATLLAGARWPWQLDWAWGLAALRNDSRRALGWFARGEWRQLDGPRVDADAKDFLTIPFGPALFARTMAHTAASMADEHADPRVDMVAWRPINPITPMSLAVATALLWTGTAAAWWYTRGIQHFTSIHTPWLFWYFVVNAAVAMCDPVWSLVPWLLNFVGLGDSNK